MFYLLGLTKTLKSPLSTNPKASSNSSPVEKAIRSPSSSNKEKKLIQLSNRCQHLEQQTKHNTYKFDEELVIGA